MEKIGKTAQQVQLQIENAGLGSNSVAAIRKIIENVGTLYNTKDN